MTPPSSTLSAHLPSGTGPATSGSGRTDAARLKQAAQAFEAIFTRQMLAAARASRSGSELFGSQAADTFHQMQDEAFADIAAKSGALGLGAVIEKQLAARIGAASPAGNG